MRACSSRPGRLFRIDGRKAQIHRLRCKTASKGAKAPVARTGLAADPEAKRDLKFVHYKNMT
jgi:hypothetical protein